MKSELAPRRSYPTFNRTIFELLTSFRREPGNQLRLLGALIAGLLLPFMLMLLALLIQNAATNLENRRHFTAFISGDSNTGNNAVVEQIRHSLTNSPLIERVTLLPATNSTPAMAEIQPVLSATAEQVTSLAHQLENSAAVSFVFINQELFNRNTRGYRTSKTLSFFLSFAALMAAGVFCILVIRKEIVRANSADINLQRHLGASHTAITRPYIYRAALLTSLATGITTLLIAGLYLATKHYVDISSYGGVLPTSLFTGKLMVFVMVSVLAASFAAATALNGNILLLNQLFKK